MVRFIIEHIRQRLQQARISARPSQPGPSAEATPPPDPSISTQTPASAEPEPPKHRRGPLPAEERTNPEEAGDGDRGGAVDTEDAPPKSRRRRRRRRPRRRTDSEPIAVETPQPESDWDPSSFVVEPMEGKTRFHDLSLHPAVMHAIADLAYPYCTPIQSELLPHALAGRDALGKAQTGTGKTAAFLIAIYQHLLTNPVPGPRAPGTPRALIVAPTRELAMQLEEDARGLGRYTGARVVAVYGGIDYAKQRGLLSDRVADIVIATPGRLLDFKKQRHIHLNQVEILVLDEADRMLDMGFIPDVRQIVHSTPTKDRRQTMFFSATFNPDVHRMGQQWTRDPVFVEIEPEEVAVKSVEQRVYIVTADEKFPLLLNLIKQEHAERVMVFANRRDQTRKLADLLHRHDISCAMLSGDVPQSKRIQTLERFKEGDIRVLVATDVAGRGIHVEGVSHVVNFTLPQDPEDYVHRIGRTGRAGATGTSISFACEEDSFQIPAIEKFLGQDLVCIHPDEAMLQPPPPPSRTDSPYAEPRHPRRRRSRTGRSTAGRRSRGPARRHPRRRSSS